MRENSRYTCTEPGLSRLLGSEFSFPGGWERVIRRAAMLIYSRPITVAYHANRASCASCWSACYLLLLIVLPYVLAIAMGAFWTKDAFEREQPGVRFRHEVLVEAYLADGTAIGWSTSDQLNTALGSRLRPCQLRAWPEDTDRDGKPEALQFSLKVPLDADGGERLHGLTVLVGVEAVYASDRFADLRLNGSVLVQHQSGLPGAGLGRTSCPRSPERCHGIPLRRVWRA